MMNQMNSLIRSEEGQGMTEYIIIVALIAIAAIGVITIFGNNLRILFTNSANALGGAQDKQQVGTTSGVAKRRQLDTFSNGTSGKNEW